MMDRRLKSSFARAAEYVAPPQKHPPPFSLRLTFEERAKLDQMAGDMPLGAYIRSIILGDDVAPRRMRGKRPVEDYVALGQVLGALGQSRLANNLNQLAHAANTGTLDVSEEIEAELLDACAAVQLVRSDLIKALGLGQALPPSGGDPDAGQ